MIEDSYKHKGMRRILVEKLREKGIKDDNVLAAIGKVPRHVFFEKAFEEHSYQDKAFPIGEGQTISQPFTVAFQTELLSVNKGDKILEIGTGSGYQSCVLLELGAKLTTIETHKPLYEKAKFVLSKLKYFPTFVLGDGSLGYPLYSPYDKIIVTAGSPKIPEPLIAQLNIGGVLVIPVGDENSQIMVRLTKLDKTRIQKEEFGEFRFVPLTGKEGWN